MQKAVDEDDPHFDLYAGRKQPPVQFDAIDMYRTQVLAQESTKDPVEWWAECAVGLTGLRRYALRYLCTPASSIPSEALFSDAGNTFTDNRSRLKPETLAALLLTKKNCGILSDIAAVDPNLGPQIWRKPLFRPTQPVHAPAAPLSVANSASVSSAVSNAAAVVAVAGAAASAAAALSLHNFGDLPMPPAALPLPPVPKEPESDSEDEPEPLTTEEKVAKAKANANRFVDMRIADLATASNKRLTAKQKGRAAAAPPTEQKQSGRKRRRIVLEDEEDSDESYEDEIDTAAKRRSPKPRDRTPPPPPPSPPAPSKQKGKNGRGKGNSHKRKKK